MNNKKRKIISFVISLVLIVFIWHNFKVSGNNIIYSLIFAGIFVLNNYLINGIKKRAAIISGVIGFFFSILEILGNSLSIDNSLAHVIDKWLPLNFVGYFLIGAELTIILFKIFDKDYSKVENKKLIRINTKINEHPAITFAITTALVLIAYLPFFLRFFPGILTNDSMDQIFQVAGDGVLNSHHPLIHTFFIGLFTNLGKNIFGDINAGVALYSITQMIIMAVSFSAVLEYLRRRNVSIVLRITALLFFMFYLPNAIYSVTMWKDILFSVWAMLFVVNIHELFTNTDKYLSKKRNWFLFAIITLLFMFAKKNGMYIAVPTLVVVFIFLMKKYWKKLLPLFAGTIIIYFIVEFITFNVIKVPKGSEREMLSIPLQQIARTVKGYKEEMDQETLDQVDKFFNVENIEDYYEPRISDPVKNNINEEYYKEHKGELWSLWFKLFKMHPGSYITAFLSNSFGYYYIETNYFVTLRIMEENKFGINRTPLISEETDKIIPYGELEGYSRDTIFFDIGLFFWLAVITLGYTICKKRYREIILFIPLALIWATMILSPVYAEYRYGYPLVLSLVVLMILAISKNKQVEAEKGEENG